MNKKIGVILIVLVTTLLFACGGNDEGTPQEDKPIATDSLKTGLAVVTSLGKSADAGAENGLAQVDSSVVALTLDKDGRIASCAIDGVQAKMMFSKEGKVVTDLTTKFPTKNEMGAEYGMAKASSIGKEWNDQAKTLADYVTGKTVDEVKGIAVNEKGAPTDADLAASVTISISGYIDAIEKAADDAENLGAKVGDKLGIGIDTNMEKSKDATAEEDGECQAYSTYTATTVDDKGVITSCIIDSTQGSIAFGMGGKIKSDIKKDVESKNILGDDYGLKKASSIGKEWNEQAASFATYVTGKSVEEVNGIAVSDEDKTTDSDLAASVTISIGSFQDTVEKAVNGAR